MSDGPIYGCDHCRKNGTFDPSRFEFLPAEKLPGKSSNRTAGTEAGMTDMDGKYIRYPDADFLSERDVRTILEGLGIKADGDPVNEGLQRNRFGKGLPGMDRPSRPHTKYPRAELWESDRGND